MGYIALVVSKFVARQIQGTGAVALCLKLKIPTAVLDLPAYRDGVDQIPISLGASMIPQTSQKTLFLTVDQVANRYGVSTDSIWRWKRDGIFPAPVRVGPNCTRWREVDLLEHESQLQACFAFNLILRSAA